MCTETELYHYGIKGMRWGVRRFQKKNGQLTSAGKKRYDESESRSSGEKKKSRHQLAVEEKYRKEGLSAREAEEKARKRIKAERILTAAAGMTVAACAAYVVHNKIKERSDGLIKAGTSLQRIEMQDTGGKLHNMFYASTGKHDNNRYAGILGAARHITNGEAYIMELQAGKDIKVASRDKAAKVFGELYKNDPDFRQSVADHVSQHFRGGNRVKNINDMSPKNIKKMYENFNSDLIDMRSIPSRPDKLFYNKLKSSGYTAIQDVNDMKFTGLKAKNPLIVFGETKNIMVKSVKRMDGDKLMVDAVKETAKAQGEAFVDEFMKTTIPMTAFLTTSLAVRTYADDYDNSINKYKESRRREK